MTPTPPRHRAADLVALPLGAWEPTKAPLQLWAQLVGKVRLVAASARRNRW